MPKAWFTSSGSFALTTFLQTLSGLVSAKFLWLIMVFVKRGVFSVFKNASRLPSASSRQELEVWLCVLPAFAPKLSPRTFFSDKSQKVLAERKT